MMQKTTSIIENSQKIWLGEQVEEVELDLAGQTIMISANPKTKVEP
jgi:hypothetical protein